MAAEPNAIPRQVRNIYMVRTVSFVWCLLVVGLQAWERVAPIAYSS